MTETTELKETCVVRLAGPELWRERLEGGERLLRGLIQTLHDRHLGVTPSLAEQLAAALDPQQRHFDSRGNPWLRAVEQLKRVLRLQEEGVGESQGGILISAAPSYFVLRVAAFLLDRACRHLGENILFCEDRYWPPQVSAKDYQQYEQNLTVALTEIIDDPHDELDVFWRESAAALSSQARFLVGGSTHETPLPQAAPVATALFQRLCPDVGEQPLDQRTIRRAEQNRPRRTTKRQRRTEGVHGVTITRSLENFSDILVSELTLPKMLLIQRLANEGYLARFRPPRREQNRDVLLAALLPGELRETALGAFLKTCWFDLCVRLGQRLHRSGLRKSEFRLVEGDRLGLCRNEAFSLAALSSWDQSDDEQPSEFFRYDFLNSLRWLPRFLEQQGEWSEPLALRGDNAMEWFAAAWRSQTGSPSQPSNRNARSSRRQSPLEHDFKWVHIMAFCPLQLGRSNAASISKRLRKQLVKKASSATKLSITWAPEKGVRGTWRFESGRGEGEKITAKQEGAQAVSHLAGQLVEAWLQSIQREIWNG